MALEILGRDQVQRALHFTKSVQIFALKSLGKEHADAALKITSLHAASALKILLMQAYGTLRTATEEDLSIANSIQAEEDLQVFKAEHAEYSVVVEDPAFNPHQNLTFADYRLFKEKYQKLRQFYGEAPHVNDAEKSARQSKIWGRRQQ